MSFQAMAWAVEQTLPATKKIVLLMLANRVNSDTGKCVPKIKTLASDCGLSESATKSALKELVDLGLIRVHQRFYEGQQLPNQYELCTDGVGLQMTHPGQQKSPVGRQLATESGKESVIEPKDTPRKRVSTGKTFLKDYLEQCKAEGKKPIPDDHCSRRYARDAGISDDMLALAWFHFVDKHTEGTSQKTKYADWGLAFNNAVKDNWAKLWYFHTDSGQVMLTSQGQLYKAVIDKKMGA